MIQRMWTEFISNKEGVDRIFPDQPFGDTVSLQKIEFEGSGTKITLDLSEWPNSPPSKWIGQGFNAVQLTLELGACSEAVLRHWAMTNVGEIRVKLVKGSELLSFKFVSKSGAYYSCVCDCIFLSKISAYKNA